MDVTIERYAEIRAELEAGRLRDDVLARAGLTVDEWIAVQRGWLEQLARELTRNRFELTNRYSRVFLDHQRALTTAETRLPAPAPALPHPPEAALRPGLPAMIAPMHAVAPVIFEADTAPMPPRVVRPAAALAGTMNVDRSVFGAALPFAPGSPAPAIATATERPALPKVNRAPAELTGTRGVDVSAFGAALPFLGRPASPPPISMLDAAAPPPPLAPPLEALNTAPGEAITGAAPFRVPKVKRADPLLSGTMNADNSVFGPTLPFAGGSSAPAIALPALPKVNRPSAELTGTRGVEVSAFSPALPFLGGAPSPAAPPVAAPGLTPSGNNTGLDSWTVEHYASLCAEMAFNPAATAETLSRYRLTSESKIELDHRWKVRLSGDRAALDKWQSAYQTYLTFLGSQRR